MTKGKVNTLNLIASNGNILQDGLELVGAKEGKGVRTQLMLKLKKRNKMIKLTLSFLASAYYIISIG